MTTAQTRLAAEGRDYWQQYIYLNGFAMEPTDAGLRTLSRNLDISIAHLRKCIHLYLSA